MKPWPIVAALVAVILAFAAGAWIGSRLEMGREAAELVQQQKATIAAAELASRKEAERLAAQQGRDDLARQLEDQAYADRTADCSLSRGRVQRLQKR